MIETSTDPAEERAATTSETIDVVLSTATKESSSAKDSFPRLSSSSFPATDTPATKSTLHPATTSKALGSTSSSSTGGRSTSTTQTTLPTMATSISMSTEQTLPVPITTKSPLTPPLTSTIIVQSTVTNIASGAPASTTSATVQHRGCQPGSDCAWQVAVGVSFGCVLLFAAVFVVLCKYRKSLIHSRQSYIAGRWRHKYDENRPYGDDLNDKQHNSVGLTQLPSHSPPPEYARQDEQVLPNDVQQVVDRVNNMRNQNTRLPANTYGSVVRKPCPNYRDF